jgi:DNA polymerase-3 subunit epsilon
MIVLDVEASGVSPEKCSILSVGALDLDEPTNQFYEECRIWDGAHIEDDALAVNGFTRDEASDPRKKSESELVKTFIAWATDRPKEQTLAGQNPSFDRDFIQAACHRAGVEFPFAHRTIDTHTLAWLHMTERGVTPPETNKHSALNLDAALIYVGVPEEPKPHNALTGAYAHAEVISRIAYNKKLLPEFAAYEIPWLN